MVAVVPIGIGIDIGIDIGIGIGIGIVVSISTGALATPGAAQPSRRGPAVTCRMHVLY